MKKTKRAAELQPKDRINFYKNSIPMTAEIYRVQEIGGQVVVECCGGHTLYFHPKQQVELADESTPEPMVNLNHHDRPKVGHISVG